MINKYLIAFIIVLSFISCNNDDPSKNQKGVVYGTFTDTRDGHVYKTVKIGTQTWMAENLAYMYQSDDKESNLDPCFYVYDYSGTDLTTAKSTSAYEKYGVLYNYLAAQRAVPDGWHLPTISEWNAIAYTLGGLAVAGGKMKTTQGWKLPNLNASNSSGFSALPGGIAFFPSFQQMEIQAAWWSSSASTAPEFMKGKFLLNDSEELMDCSNSIKRGMSVRCVKD